MALGAIFLLLHWTDIIMPTNYLAIIKAFLQPHGSFQLSNVMQWLQYTLMIHRYFGDIMRFQNFRNSSESKLKLIPGP